LVAKGLAGGGRDECRDCGAEYRTECGAVIEDDEVLGPGCVTREIDEEVLVDSAATKMADVTVQGWLSELPVYRLGIAGFGFGVTRVPVPGQAKPLTVRSWLVHLAAGRALVRLECVSECPGLPRGYLRGSLADWADHPEEGEVAEVDWKFLADGQFDRSTFVEILAAAYMYEAADLPGEEAE
jgi:hypothetical protein